MKKLLLIIILFINCIFLTSCSLIGLDFSFEFPELITTNTTLDGNTNTTSNTTNSTSNNTVTNSSSSNTTLSSSTSSNDNENTSMSTYYDLSKEGYYNWYYANAIGDLKILVIPVTIGRYSFNDDKLNNLNKTLFGDEDDVLFESLTSYYYKSSYGKLNITGTIAEPTSKYEMSQFEDDESIIIGDTDKILKEQNIDPKDYDSDNDGYIDCIFYIYSAPNTENSSRVPSYFWAYSTCAELEADIDNPVVNNYCFASIDFMIEEGQNDAHTFIHEFGHLLGLDDYYNADEDSRTGDPVGYSIMMSYNIQDHDAFSKLSLGWIENPQIIDSTSNQSTYTIELKPIAENPDCLIIANKYDGSPFAEYIIIEYYTPTTLNEYNSITDCGGVTGVNDSGIRIYHVDARLGYYTDDEYDVTIIDNYSDFDSSMGTIAFCVHSNTPSYSLFYDEDKRRQDSETTIPLLELIDASGDSHLEHDFAQDSDSLFKAGSSLDLSTITMNNNEELDYTITISSIDSEKAVLNISKNK